MCVRVASRPSSSVLAATVMTPGTRAGEYEHALCDAPSTTGCPDTATAVTPSAMSALTAASSAGRRVEPVVEVRHRRRPLGVLLDDPLDAGDVRRRRARLALDARVRLHRHEVHELRDTPGPAAEEVRTDRGVAVAVLGALAVTADVDAGSRTRSLMSGWSALDAGADHVRRHAAAARAVDVAAIELVGPLVDAVEVPGRRALHRLRPHRAARAAGGGGAADGLDEGHRRVAADLGELVLRERGGVAVERVREALAHVAAGGLARAGPRSSRTWPELPGLRTTRYSPETAASLAAPTSGAGAVAAPALPGTAVTRRAAAARPMRPTAAGRRSAGACHGRSGAGQGCGADDPKLAVRTTLGIA